MAQLLGQLGIFLTCAADSRFTAATSALSAVSCAQAEHGCEWRGARRGLAAHAGRCWYERGRRHLEQAQAAVRSNERRAEELKQANLAAAERAAAELAEVRAEAAAQLAALKTEVCH